MKTVVYIVSNVDRWVAFEWLAAALAKSYDIRFILLNPGGSHLENYLNETGTPCSTVVYNGKSSIPFAIFKVAGILRKIKPDIVHCHFVDASIVGLSAAWLAKVRARIYTRHHSVYHHLYAKKGVYYDLLCNRLATKIVAISRVVEDVLVIREAVPPEKVIVINHGFDFSFFENINQDRLNELKKRITGHPVVGVVARYIEWKGVIYIVRAFRKLLEKYPNAHLLLLNARGPDKDSIAGELLKLPVGTYIEIPFTNEIQLYYRLMDIYVHVPVDAEVEAFGQTYIEALAAGVPSIFTLSGIANEFIKDRQNAMIVPYKDSFSMLNAISELLTDANLRQQIADKGRTAVREKFELEKMVQLLNGLYSES